MRKLRIENFSEHSLKKNQQKIIHIKLCLYLPLLNILIMKPLFPLLALHFPTPCSPFRDGYSLTQTISRKLIFTFSYSPLIIFIFPHLAFSDISNNTNITAKIFYPRKWPKRWGGCFFSLK